jgi:hypothetical protein
MSSEIEALLENNYQWLLDRMMKKVESARIAEDVTQQTAAALVAYVFDNPAPQPIRAWLAKTADRIAIDHFRKTSRRPRSTEPSRSKIRWSRQGWLDFGSPDALSRHMDKLIEEFNISPPPEILRFYRLSVKAKWQRPRLQMLTGKSAQLLRRYHDLLLSWIEHHMSLHIELWFSLVLFQRDYGRHEGREGELLQRLNLHKWTSGLSRSVSRRMFSSLQILIVSYEFEKAAVKIERHCRKHPSRSRRLLPFASHCRWFHALLLKGPSHMESPDPLAFVAEGLLPASRKRKRKP